MTCQNEDLKAKLYEYWDGELAAFEAEKVSSHLKTCTDCLQEYESLKTIKAAFFQPVQVSSLSDDLADKVMERIENEKAGERFSLKEFVKWAVPSLGFVFGTLLFFAIAPIHDDAPFSAGSFLTQSDASLQMMLGMEESAPIVDGFSEENL